MIRNVVGTIEWASACTVTVLLVGFASVEPASAEAPRGPAEASPQVRAQPTDSLPSAEEIARSFESDGDPDAGREGIRARAAAAPPARATLWIQLLAVAERVESASAAVRAVGLASEGEEAAGAELLMEIVAGARPDDRPALLHLAELLVEVDDPRAAAEIRGRLLEEYPDAPEAAETMLREARRLLEDEEHREEGLALLERLLVGSPEHPIAPEARRLFDRERARSIPEGQR